MIMKKLGSLKDKSKNKSFIQEIKNIAFDKSDNNEVVWKAVDDVHEKLRDFDKDKILKYLVGLWALKINQFGEVDNI